MEPSGELGPGLRWCQPLGQLRQRWLLSLLGDPHCLAHTHPEDAILYGHILSRSFFLLENKCPCRYRQFWKRKHPGLLHQLSGDGVSGVESSQDERSSVFTLRSSSHFIPSARTSAWPEPQHRCAWQHANDGTSE